MHNIFWNYGSDGFSFSAMVALLGTGASAFLGGFDKMLGALTIFMILDFVLGFTAAWKLKCIDSKTMFWGGVNKILVLSLVGVGVILDWVFGLPEPWVRTSVIWFYIGREFLSMMENYGKLGFKVPPFVADVLQQINIKSERKNLK